MGFCFLYLFQCVVLQEIFHAPKTMVSFLHMICIRASFVNYIVCCTHQAFYTHINKHIKVRHPDHWADNRSREKSRWSNVTALQLVKWQIKWRTKLAGVRDHWSHTSWLWNLLSRGIQAAIFFWISPTDAGFSPGAIQILVVVTGPWVLSNQYWVRVDIQLDLIFVHLEYK